MKLDNIQQRMSLMAIIMSTAAAGGGGSAATAAMRGRPSIFNQQLAKQVGKRKSMCNRHSKGCFVSLAAVDQHVIEPKSGMQQQPRYIGSATRKRFRKEESEATTTDFSPADIFMKSSAPLMPSPSADLPPWLARFSFDQPQEMQRPPSPLYLQERLSALRTSMAESSHLSDKQMRLVVRAMETATKSDPSKLLGVMDFLSILVEYMEMDHEALIAASFHYCACLTAREAGSSSRQTEGECLVDGVAGFDVAYLRPLAGSGLEYFGSQSVKIAIDAARLKGIEAVASTYVSTTSDNRQQQNYRPRLSEFDDLRSLLLTVNAGRDWKALAIRCAASLFRLRGSLSARKTDSNIKKHPTAQEVAVSREALHVYAPLAEQLGMHRLKSEIESSAFSILYRRQHQAVMSLCNNRVINDRSESGRFVMRHGIPIPTDNNSHRTAEKDCAFIESVDDGMKSVMEDITFRMKRILYEDNTLMEHVENICVVARIKEPYSLWRKMLKIHTRHTAVGKKGHFMTPIFSVLDVPDAIAIRAILSARKLDPNEDDEVTSARERALCYHVYNLCQNSLPNYSVDMNGDYSNRFKDYIKDPKPNGYQSLHFSARTRWHGEDWPFEVQVRSAEMHKVAEYGLAAHWRYKLDSQENHDACSVHEESDPPQLNSISPSFESSSAFPFLDKQANGIDHDDIFRSEQIRARAQELAPYIEALSEAGSSLAREKLFIFLDQAPPADTSQENGSSKAILSLPSGATVLDAMREAERKSGTNLLGSIEQEKIRSIDPSMILRNGVSTTMTEPLENGDIITLCTNPVALSADESFFCS